MCSRIIKSVSTKGKISTKVAPRTILPKPAIALSGIANVQTVKLVQPVVTKVIDEINLDEVISSKSQTSNVSSPVSSLVISSVSSGWYFICK